MNIHDAYTDFILSREALNVTQRTLSFYKFNLSKFIDFLEREEISQVNNIRTFHIRLFLKSLRDKDLSDSYIHTYARVIKTLVRFMHKEGYIENFLEFEMPKLADKRLRVLSAKEIQRVVNICESLRDKLIILFFVDTGVRLSELCSLNWSDLNIDAGSVLVRRGKGNKFRVVGIGVKTRRLILRYKNQLDESNTDENKPLIQTYKGTRFTPMGIRSLILRLSEKSAVDFTAHSLRRSFAKLSIKAGMNIVYLQSLMGHSNIDTTRHYVQKLDDEEIIQAHKEHGTVDNFLNL